MNTIEIQSDIEQLVKRVYDDDILAIVQKLLAKYADNEPIIWDELPAELQKKLEKAEEDSKAGRITPHEEVVKKFRQKYAHFYES